MIYINKVSWIKNIKFIAVVGFSITLYLSYTGFCFEKMQYLSEKDIQVPVYEVVQGIAENGLAKQKFVETPNGGGYDYDDSDIKKIEQNVDDFLKKHPENIRINHNYSFDQSETYDAFVSYIFTEEEAKQINAHVQKKGGWQSVGKIIGISYWQSYSACGHPTFGMQDYIYDKITLYGK
jgi:hypothetical protein